MIDTHCHLTFPDFKGRVADSLSLAAAHGVTGAITFDSDRNPVKPAVVIKVEAGVEKFAASIAP